MTWGLIGASTIAAEHMIGAIRATGGTVAHVVSGNAAYAASYAAAHGIAAHGCDLAAMLADPGIGAVYISSTNDKHRAQALAAIAAGKHVLCEKPLALTVADAEVMVEAAEAAGLVFATNHHLRNAGSHQTIRDLIHTGRIGRVLSVRVHHAVMLPPHLQGWRINDPKAGGGVIPDITVHDADTVRFLLGEDPQEVVAMAVRSGLGDGVEDSVMSVWSMPSGVQVFAHESFTHAFAGSGVEVHGTEGSVFARGVMTQRPLGDITLVTAQGAEAVPFPTHNLYVQGIERFLSAIAGTGRPAADGWDGLRSLAVALTVRAAALSGTRQRVVSGA